MIWVSQYVNNCHECHKWLREGVRRKMTFNDDNEVDGYKGLMIICEPIMYLIWNVNMWVVKKSELSCSILLPDIGLIERVRGNLSGWGKSGNRIVRLESQRWLPEINNCNNELCARAGLCYQVFLLYAFTIQIIRDSVKNVLTIM